MIAGLKKSERQFAIVISLLLGLFGMTMAIAGRADPIGTQGFIIVAFAVLVIATVANGYYLPEPSEDRLTEYYDDPTRAGIIIAMIWGVIAMFVGDWVAWLQIGRAHV